MSFKRVVVAFLFLAVTAFALPGAASALKFEPSAASPLTGPLIPGSLASGDLNGDGDDDLVIAARGNSTGTPGLYVRLSDGDGGFTAAPGPALLVDSLVTGLQMGQLNPETDSDLDLIAFTDYYSEFHTLLGNGDGTFTDAGVTNIGTSPYSGGPTTQLGDLNGDGVVDLAVAGYPNKISAAINDGEGVFTVGAQQTVAGATELDSLAIGDFDGDGKNDLAMSNFGGGAAMEKWAVYAMKGNGDGAFADVAGNPFQMRSGNIARSVATMDLNGDASDDLAVTTQPGNDPSANQIQTLLGNGSTFFAQNPAGTVPAEDTPFNVFAGDIDGDGFNDDAGSGNFGGGNVSIGLGDHAGALTVPFGSPFSLGVPPPGKRYYSQGAVIGDFNNDGGPDLAVGSDASIDAVRGVAILMAGSDLRPAREEIQFGDWQVDTEAPDEGLVVRNEGSAPGAVESATISGADADQFEVSQPGVGCDELAYEQDCALQVSFHPTSGGSKNATLLIGTSQSETPIEVMLSGSGVVPVADMEVSPGAIEFPETTVGDSSAARDVTITSTGNIPLRLNGSGLSGPDAADFPLNPLACEMEVLPGDSCVMTIAFKPGSAGAKTASIRLNGNIPETMVQLSGTGIATPPPPPKANLALKAPKKIKRGKKLKVTAAVTNTGASALTNVVLATKVPGKLAKAPKKITIASIPVGKTVKKTIQVAVKKKAKKGKKLTVNVSLTAAGKKLSAAKKSVRIK